MKPKLKKLSDLKPDSRNPRVISNEALDGLRNSIDAFGDIGGITVNADGTLISGHQRCAALKEEYGNLEIKDNKIVLPDGRTFPVRIVDWDNNKLKAANIAANNHHIAGTFTPDIKQILDEIELNTPDLFQDLNLEPLKCEIDTNIPIEPEKPENELGSGEEWVNFQVGSKTGVIHKDVYDLFCSEYDRLSGIIESEEITPVIEAMVANSANTPSKSLV